MYTSVLGKDSPQKERRGLVTLLLGDLLLPRGAEGTDLLPTLLNETGRDERRE